MFVQLLTLREIVRPVKRVRVLVISEHDEVLLVRNWIGNSHWEMPGGGVGRKESEKSAAARELREETGIEVTENLLQYVTTINATYQAPIYVVRINKEQFRYLEKRSWEIVATKWFHRDALPNNVSSLVRRAVSLVDGVAT